MGISMLYRNYLFLTLFLLGLAQNKAIFAGKTEENQQISWFQQIKDTFSNGICIGQITQFIEPDHHERQHVDKNPLDKNAPHHIRTIDLTRKDRQASTIRKPFLFIIQSPVRPNNKRIYIIGKVNTERFINLMYRTTRYNLMPGDCLLAATALGTAAFGYYKYFHNKS